MISSSILVASIGLLLVRADYLRGVRTTNIFVSRDDAAVTATVFRILAVGSMLQDERNSTSFSQKEEIACVLIKDGKEDDDLYDIDLPSDFIESHKDKILAGKLFVTISRTRIAQDSVEILNEGHIQIVRDPRITTRSAKPPAIGKKTVAVVRVSTRDSTPSVTAQELRQSLFSRDKVNLMTQYQACSSGQLNWELHNDQILEVFVNEPVKNFASGSSLVTAAQKVLRTTLHIEDLSKLADKTLMCLPPGTGSWVASSGVGHWRAQFNDGWCLSLSATMHELGHTLGLNHANEGGVAYGDSTGYMASGHKAPDWPQKCFNGEMHWQLGWFFRRQQTLLQDALEAGRLIKLATFVDYDLADYDEPVLLRIDDMFLQYNRAKRFNADTEEKQDQVTITRKSGGGSDALSGLSEGDRFSEFFFGASGRTLLIEACAKISGNRGADVMMISVAIGRSLCDEFYANQKAISSAMAVVNDHLVNMDLSSNAESDPIFILYQPSTPTTTSPSTSPSMYTSMSPTYSSSDEPSIPFSTPAPTLWTPKSFAMVSRFWSLLASWRERNSPSTSNETQQETIGTSRGPAKTTVVNTRDVANEDGDFEVAESPSMSSVLADGGPNDKSMGKPNRQHQSGVQSVFSSRVDGGV